MQGRQEQPESRGRTALEQALLACACAAVYFALARAGLALALGSSNASPLWPAAGFALAGAALWGPAASLGVFLGAALAYERPELSGQSPALAAALGAAALAGLGAAAQAQAGASLLRRAASSPAPAPRAEEAAYVCLLAPLVALIGPAFELLALAAGGASPEFGWVRAGLTSWIGNAVCLLVAAPLILAWSRPRAGARGGSRAARERLEINRRIFDRLPMGVMLLRLDEPGNAGSLRILELNPAGRGLSEARNERVEDVSLREFAPASFETGLPAACLDVLATGKSRVIRDYRSGRVPGVYFDLTLFPLDDRVLGLAFDDVSEQRKARKMLQENAELLLLMIESVSEYAIFRLDEAGRVGSWSRGAELIYGYSAGEILGAPYARLLPPEEPPRRQLEETSRQGRVKSEAWSLRKDGSRFWADIVLTALRGETGAPLGCVAVVRDATQRRAVSQVLERRTADLSRSNLELSQFAYVASHDLSAPLHKVKAFGERLRDKLGDKIDGESADYLRRMLRAVDGMQVLIDALLALARVSTRTAKAEVVDLGTLARDVVDAFDHEIAGTRARVEIGELPRINADPLQMRQLIQNLLSNALKFHAPGTAPRVRVRGKATGDGRCELVVSDNGIGFDMKFAEKIFQPFHRLQGRSEYEGTGMGLAICQRIAARHGGTISATSEPGRGSEFKVVLPISQEGRMECQPQEKAFS